jgi:hypothetical protein
MAMKKIILFLFALLGLPLVWVLVKSLLEALAFEAVEGDFLTAGRIAFAVGCVVMTVLYAWKGQAWQILYIFAHEMTHALVGVLFFARIHKVSVKMTGGFVQLSKSNLLITLAPYCVPFYLLMVVIFYGIVQWFVPGILPFWVWAFLFGVTTAFHVWYTANALLSVSQPDTHEYGRFFSWWFIVMMNLFFATLAIVITSPKNTLRAQGKRWAETTRAVYTQLYHGAKDLKTQILTKTSISEGGNR